MINYKILQFKFNDSFGRRSREMNKRFTFILKVFVFLGFVIFFQACDGSKTTKEVKKMPVTKKISMEQPAKPPVDMSVPNRTETATFALG